MVSLTVLCGTLLFLIRCSGTDVLVLPLGLTRAFVCTSPSEPGYGIIWLVNGILAQSSQLPYIALGEEVQSGDGVVQRNITFTADIRANNTHLRCIVTNFEGDSHISVDLNLILQGYLPSPDVAYTFMKHNHSVQFSWSVPFTLNVTDLEPDILHYTIYISIDDDTEVVANTTYTLYLLQADPCRTHTYKVAVAAVNVVGVGEKQTLSKSIKLEGYATLLTLNNTVLFKNGVPIIQAAVQVVPPCYGNIEYELELHTTFSEEKQMLCYSWPATFHTFFMYLAANDIYTIIIGIKEEIKSKPTSITASTFDVQYVSVTAHSVDPGYVDPGCMDVVCHFASGSWAKGCKISAILVEQDEELLICEYSIARKREKSVSMAIALPEGEYRLLVYDVEAVSNAELPNPAFTTHITVEDSSVTECSGNTSQDIHQDNFYEIMMTVPVAGGGLVLFMITSLVCLTVLTVLIKRKKRKAGIITAPNIAYEEVNQTMRHKRSTHGQHVQSSNPNS